MGGPRYAPLASANPVLGDARRTPIATSTRRAWEERAKLSMHPTPLAVATGAMWMLNAPFMKLVKTITANDAKQASV